MTEKTRCAGVALARMFLKNPGLPNQIRSGAEHAMNVHEMLNAMRNAGSPEGPLREFARRALPPEEFRAFIGK